LVTEDADDDGEDSISEISSLRDDKGLGLSGILRSSTDVGEPIALATRANIPRNLVFSLFKESFSSSLSPTFLCTSPNTFTKSSICACKALSLSLVPRKLFIDVLRDMPILSDGALNVVGSFISCGLEVKLAFDIVLNIGGAIFVVSTVN
jgi:hypothetical protein